jgi:peptidyl-prolyl cis-trans isomerase SurA
MMKFIIQALILFFCTFVFSAADAAIKVADPLDRIVAVVNDDVITAQELDTELNNIKRQYRQQNTRLPSDAILKPQLLERMILQKIQLQQAQRVHIKVDDEMLNRALDNIAQQNHLTLTQLRQTLEEEGNNFEDFRENLRKQIIINELQRRQVLSTITVTKQEIDTFLKNQERQGGKVVEYHIGHILIALPEAADAEQIAKSKTKAEGVLAKLQKGADFAQTAIAVSDGQQALKGGDLGWRRAEALPTLFSDWLVKQDIGSVSNIIRSPSGFHIIKLLGKRTDEQKHVVKQIHARHILIKTGEFTSSEEALARLMKLKKRLDKGEDFGRLAKLYSEDPGSAENGGDLGWVNPGEMVPAFQQAMDSLPVNKISDPVRTKYGWHLIQVLGKRSHDDTEEFRQNKARQAIRERKTEPALQNWLRNLRDEAYVVNRL